MEYLLLSTRNPPGLFGVIMYFIMTSDVETTSLELNRPDDSMAEKIYRIGLPRLIDLYSKYDVDSTFFFTAHILKLKPEIIDIVKAGGHEIACHGYKHEPEYFFDALSLKNQIHYLKLSKEIIEKEANTKIKTFRAPELLLNENTVVALEKTGFKYDSSIPSQRFDGPLSRGFRKKIKWIQAPRKPYRLSYNSIFQKGDSKIIEIPISSFIFSYMGTTMRVSPRINQLVQRIIFSESRKKEKPAVFIIHPTELIELDSTLMKSSTSISGTFFSGVVRKRIKHKNLGSNAQILMEQLLKYAKDEGFQFTSIENYCKNIWKES